MFKGPTGPQSGRTGRSQAEKIGTDPGGFKEGPAYDVTGGHPITKDQPSQQPKERSIPDPKQTEPMGIPAPFTIGQ